MSEGKTESKSTESSSIATTQSPHQSLKFAVSTHVGMRRSENQDSYGVIENEYYRFFIVADGMGGVRGGAFASKLAVQVVTTCLQNVKKISRNDISSAVSYANKAIFESGLDDPALLGMGTTFVGLCFLRSTMLIVNVGDSRAYRIRARNIQQLTDDHTLVNELLKSGALSPDQAENNPVSHMLTRSLGPTAAIEVDCWVAEETPQKGDRFLLCSDGLYNMLDDSQICQVVSDYDPEKAVNKLISLANSNGGNDNITVIIIEAGEEYGLNIEAESLQSDTVEIPSQEISTINGIENSETLDDTLDNDIKTESDTLDDDNKIKISINDKKQDASRRPAIVWASLCLLVLAIFTFASYRYGVWASKRQQITKNTVIENPIKEEAIKKQEVKEDQQQELISENEKQDLLAEIEKLNRQTAIAGEDLELEVKNLQEQIYMLSQADSEQLLADNKANQELLQQLDQQRDELGTKIDIASRKLAVWYGRQKRLETTDEISMAAEVAVFSDQVKAAKDNFEKVTWDYLKSREEYQYDPQNISQKQKVNELVLQRKIKLKELKLTVRESIQNEINSAQDGITEFTKLRDELDERMLATKVRVTFTDFIINSDDVSKQEKTIELLKELDSKKTKLWEIAPEASIFKKEAEWEQGSSSSNTSDIEANISIE